MDIYRRLVDAMQESEDAKNAPKESDVVGGPKVGWRVVVNPYLAPDTICVSPQIFKILKEAADDLRNEPKPIRETRQRF